MCCVFVWLQLEQMREALRMNEQLLANEREEKRQILDYCDKHDFSSSRSIFRSKERDWQVGP